MLQRRQDAFSSIACHSPPSPQAPTEPHFCSFSFLLFTFEARPAVRHGEGRRRRLKRKESCQNWKVAMYSDWAHTLDEAIGLREVEREVTLVTGGRVGWT